MSNHNLLIHRADDTAQDDQCISVRNTRDEVASDVGTVAALHGRDLSHEGFTIEQVVRDYGNVCQAVTKLAIETEVPISVDEFRNFNQCLDNAIASAVTDVKDLLRSPPIPLPS